MERILFLIPPYIGYESFINPAYNDGVMVKKTGTYRNIVAEIPMGPISISAYIKKHVAVHIKLIDFNTILQQADEFSYASFEEFYSVVLSQWHDFSPTIVGLSVLFTPSYRNMLGLAKTVRNLFPDALIIGGGGIATNMYREIFRDSTSFDALCFGEGEHPMLGLVMSDHKIAFLESNDSWITRKKTSANTEFKHDFVENLDDIPFWDFGILDRRDYHINTVISTFVMVEEKTLSMPVMTSRGCPHKCCFCASHTVHGRSMRYQSLDRIRADFTALRDRYGVATVVFYDDHLMSSKRRALDILQILRHLNMKAFFPASLALYALNREVLEALKSVGLTSLVLSVESGSNRVLRKIMHKPLNLKIVSQVIADCKDLDIATDVAILIGLPGETKQDIEDTLEFLKTLHVMWFRINIATPLLGTEMLEICLKNGYLIGDYLACDFKRAIVKTEDFSPEYIQDKVYSMNLELNFVRNNDYISGNYERAILGFENALRVKNDHAFAYYFAAKCYKEISMMGMYETYRAKYAEIISHSEFWKNHAIQFSLEPLTE